MENQLETKSIFKFGAGKREKARISAFDWGLAVFLVIVILITFIPIWYAVVVSVTPLELTKESGYNLFLSPLHWSFAAYVQLFSQDSFLQALWNSLVLTTMAIIINMVLTTLTAYGLIFKDMPGRNLILTLILFTFLFNAGLVPTYILVKNLNLLDTYMAIILPNAVSVYNMLVMRAFFQNIPASLRESAIVDGANEFQVLWRIVLPLSKPILLTIGLFYAVTQWNDFFNPILYLSNNDLMPLPVLLRNILMAGNINDYVEINSLFTAPQDALKMAAVILTMVPMLIVYPWIQRHFTKGVLVGSVKE
ncbi:carbohydrate ABC transporter permease [Dictyobacter aurantiacus]|uniref:Putative ABC transporter permease protein YtcP n=1 Tax=Dictyobacter aurantiacus TaxID=1936993 RepID=A0A401ZGP9_9CHLR|nr:carbohydrate ABC transporter permease [Dictyobacter aurantiacus]GCE05973.1 putative ABC transporter permease protein YtcP [Dictyobacter aurantiacus]